MVEAKTGSGKVGLSADTWLAWINSKGWADVNLPGAAWATAIDGTALFQNESLVGDISIARVPNITQAFDYTDDAYISEFVCEGDITLAMCYEGFEDLLLHAFGAVQETAGVSGTFDREFHLSSSGRYQNANSRALNLYLSRGIVGSGNTLPTIFTYAGMVVDAFEFSGTRGSQLDLTLSFFGRQEFTTLYAAPTLSLPTSGVPLGTECTVTWDSAKIPVTDWRIRVSRNLDRERRFAGSRFTMEPPMSKYDVTAEFTTEWDNETRGTATMRTDQQYRQARELKFNWKNETGNVIPGTNQQWEFDLVIPNAIIEAMPINVAGAGRVTVPVTVRGYDDDVTSNPHMIYAHQIAELSYSDPPGTDF